MNLALARESPLGYGLAAKPAYKSARHLEFLNAAIMDAIYGGCRRLMVNEPPRHAKSTLASEWAPAWYLGQNPDRKVILVTHTGKLAKRFGRRVRRLVEQHGLRTHGIVVSDESSSADEWEIAGHEGGMIATGVGGGITGYGGDLILLDDLIKDGQQAHSVPYCESVWDWMLAVVEERAETPDSSIILTGTRWSEGDPCGRILADPDLAPEWRHIRLPALAESDDPLGREEGAALWPERWPVEALLRKKRSTSAYAWASEYQQRPAPEEGDIIKREWIQRWRILPQFDTIIQSWDLNLKATSGGSYACGQVWGRAGARYYLIDRRRGRWGFDEVIAAIRGLSSIHPRANLKLVEEAAIGPAAVSHLKGKVGGLVLVKVTGATGGKVARLRGVSPYFEAGNVFVPEQGATLPGGAVCTWGNEYVEAVCTFPHGDGTDDGDATSQALARLALGSETHAATTATMSGREQAAAERIRAEQARLQAQGGRSRIERPRLWEGQGPPTFPRGRNA